MNSGQENILQTAALGAGQLPVGGVGQAVQQRDDDPGQPVHDVGGDVCLVVVSVGVQLDHDGCGECAEEVGDQDPDDGPGHPLLSPVLLLLPGDVLEVVPVQTALGLDDTHSQAVMSEGSKKVIGVNLMSTTYLYGSCRL